MEQELQRIAVSVAHEDWERFSGFGLYHANQKTQEAEIAKARKKVDKWFELLKPAFEAK